METEEMNSYQIDARESKLNSEGLTGATVAMLERYHEKGDVWRTPFSGDHLNRATITG